MKKLLLICLWAVASVLTYAQDSANDSIRSIIRNLKLSEKYIYSESAGEGNAEGIKMLALEELKIHITDYLLDLSKTKQEIKLLQEELAPDCCVLMYQRGTVWKSFAYVAKSRVNGEQVTIEKDVPVIETPKEEVTIPLPNPVDTDQVEVLTVEVDTTDIELTSDTVAVKVPAEDPKPETGVAFPDEDMMHQRVIKELLGLQTYENVMMYLTTMKEDGRLMYGKLSTLMNPQEAYMVIIKDGKLVTILGRGEKERMNLTTMQPDMLKNYKGHAVIWLKIYHE